MNSKKAKSRIETHERLPMLIDPISRRMFIRGLGATLAVPLLPSLLPKAHAQAVPNPVFVFTQSTHGAWQGSWWPQGVALTAVPGVPNVRSTRLSSIPGTTLGRTIGTHLNGIRDKVNIIQGLDFVSITGHDHQPYSGSFRVHYKDGDPRNFAPVFPYTIDVLLAQSSKIYPTAPKLPALRLNPRGYSEFPLSINGKNANGIPNFSPSQGTTLVGTWNYLKGHFSAAPATGNPADTQRRFLIDKVLAEFKSIVNSTKLSSADKVSLENYTDHLTDVQRTIQNSVPQTPVEGCNTLPQPSETNNNDDFNARLIDMMVLALACGVTRIATYDLNWGACASAVGDVGYHGDDGVHSCSKNAGYENVATWNGYFVKHWSNIVKKMDQHGLLERGIVTFTSDMSSSTPNHHGADMPVLTAGSLGGKLRTGEMISYYNMSHRYITLNGISSRYDLTKSNNSNIPVYAGRRWNELLVSIFHSMGMGPADYQRNGQGFGMPICEILGGQAGSCGVEDSDTYLHWKMTEYYKNTYKEPLNSVLPYFYIG